MVVPAFLCTVLSLRPARPLALAAMEPMRRAAERRLCALSRPEAAATVVRPDAHEPQRAGYAGAGVRSAKAASRCALITCLAADGGGSWSAHETANGVPYYFNAADGTSSWELPPGVTLAAPPPPPPPAASYGAETPMPGREREYAAYKAQVAAAPGAPPLGKAHGLRGAAAVQPESVGPGNQADPALIEPPQRRPVRTDAVTLTLTPTPTLPLTPTLTLTLTQVPNPEPRPATLLPSPRAGRAP